MAAAAAIAGRRRIATRVVAGAAFAATIWTPVEAAASAASTICESAMQEAARRHAVPIGVLYAVGLTETGRRGSLQPYAMNIAGAAYFARDLADALRKFEEARARGVRLIDVGCMQINHHYHARNFPSVTAMFDPARNVDYAARFLNRLHASERSWTLAVARYHAGPHNDPAQKRYVCAVIRNMVAVGVGQWTPQARAFCQ
ncbi:MAG: transglycosylase SLT domain-containing protein [Methylobacteriaceae bacterium]|nr:transglycosylase SLT domain-containing protein [Methylobacteriaceae bacterium]